MGQSSSLISTWTWKSESSLLFYCWWKSLRKKLAVLNLVVLDMEINPSIGMGTQKGNKEVFGNENPTLKKKKSNLFSQSMKGQNSTNPPIWIVFRVDGILHDELLSSSLPMLQFFFINFKTLAVQTFFSFKYKFWS